MLSSPIENGSVRGRASVVSQAFDVDLFLPFRSLHIGDSRLARLSRPQTRLIRYVPGPFSARNGHSVASANKVTGNRAGLCHPLCHPLFSPHHTLNPYPFSGRVVNLKGIYQSLSGCWTGLAFWYGESNQISSASRRLSSNKFLAADIPTPSTREIRYL